MTNNYKMNSAYILENVSNKKTNIFINMFWNLEIITR